MVELTIGTIALVPIVVGIIQMLKKLGLPDDYAPWANAALTVVGYMVIVYVKSNPRYEQPVEMVLNGIMVFLSAGGFYEVASRTVTAAKKVV